MTTTSVTKKYFREIKNAYLGGKKDAALQKYKLLQLDDKKKLLLSQCNLLADAEGIANERGDNTILINTKGFVRFLITNL